MDYVSQRQDIVDWAEKKGVAGLKAYHDQKNRVSIDGLPTPLAELLDQDHLTQ